MMLTSSGLRIKTVLHDYEDDFMAATYFTHNTPLIPEFVLREERIEVFDGFHIHIGVYAPKSKPLPTVEEAAFAFADRVGEPLYHHREEYKDLYKAVERKKAE